MTQGPRDTVPEAVHQQDSLRYDKIARVGCWYELCKVTALTQMYTAEYRWACTVHDAIGEPCSTIQASLIL